MPKTIQKADGSCYRLWLQSFFKPSSRKIRVGFQVSISKYVQFERKLLDKYIYSLPSVVLVLMMFVCIYIFFKTITVTIGEDINAFKKVDGILHAFECREGTSKSDVIYLKTSLSENNSRFTGSFKCRDLGWVKRLSGQIINYSVTFYVKKSVAEADDKPVYIYGIDYEDKKFIHPNYGLGESEMFNFLSFLFLLAAYGISGALYKRWKGVDPNNLT